MGVEIKHGNEDSKEIVDSTMQLLVEYVDQAKTEAAVKTIAEVTKDVPNGELLLALTSVLSSHLAMIPEEAARLALLAGTVENIVSMVTNRDQILAEAKARSN
jgi:hypothetical protein